MTEITVTRRIAADAERLFDAWLDPVALAAWMTPLAAVRSEASVDPRVGGAYAIAMHEDAATFVHSGVCTAIDRPRLLAFTWRSDATHLLDTQVTVRFLPDGDGTIVEVHHETLPDAETAAGHSAGWTDCLRLLELHLAASPVRAQ